MYRYPSDGRSGLFKGEHFVRLRIRPPGKRDGYRRQTVLESLPNVNKSYLLVRLTVEDGVATGTWHEHTDPKGYYKGVVYHGVLQLVIDDDGRHMKGKWLGFSNDRMINVGTWEFSFVGEKLPAKIV